MNVYHTNVHYPNPLLAGVNFLWVYQRNNIGLSGGNITDYLGKPYNTVETHMIKCAIADIANIVKTEYFAYKPIF